MQKSIIIVAILIVVFCGMNFAFSQVATTKHNLSSTSTGQAKYRHNQAPNPTDQVCVFCHTPHDSDVAFTAAPLWNRTIDSAGYTMYGTTVGGNAPNPAPPSASTLACMSCHDGVTGLSVLRNAPGPGSTAVTPSTQPTINDPQTQISKDLRNDHPVSIVYDVTNPIAASLRDPTVNGTIPGWLGAPNGRINELLKTGNTTVECSSCHDPHNNVNTLFLRTSNANSALCTGCHNK